MVLKEKYIVTSNKTLDQKKFTGEKLRIRLQITELFLLELGEEQHIFILEPAKQIVIISFDYPVYVNIVYSEKRPMCNACREIAHPNSSKRTIYNNTVLRLCYDMDNIHYIKQLSSRH